MLSATPAPLGRYDHPSLVTAGRRVQEAATMERSQSFTHRYHDDDDERPRSW